VLSRHPDRFYCEHTATLWLGRQFGWALLCWSTSVPPVALCLQRSEIWAAAQDFLMRICQIYCAVASACGNIEAAWDSRPLPATTRSHELQPQLSSCGDTLPA
jgi:hypothetical protein